MNTFDAWWTHVVGTFFLTTALVASGPAWPADWEAIAVEDAEIVLLVPGLKPDALKFEHKKRGYRSFVEKGFWVGEGGLPIAQLVLSHLDPSGKFFFASGYISPLDEEIENFLSNSSVQLGSTGSARNVLGTLEYQHYILNGTLHCVFMRQFLGPTPIDGLTQGDSGEALGTMLVEGRYCVGRGEDLNERTMAEFFAGIGIRSWAVPSIDMGR